VKSITVQIEQYLLFFPAQLASCATPATAASRFTSKILSHASLLCRRRKPTVETCVDNTAKLRPQASVSALRAAGASQLLKPASTTPRSYGRRHRSWHHDHAHATQNERRRGQRPGASAVVPRSSTGDAQRAPPRVTACAPRSSTCDAQRAPPQTTA
jgi:hypothetical protein